MLAADFAHKTAEWAAVVGTTSAAVVAIAASIERVFSPLGKLIQKWSSGDVLKVVNEIQAEVAGVKDDVHDLTAKVKHIETDVAKVKAAIGTTK